MKSKKFSSKDVGNQWWSAKILVASGTGYEEIGQRSIVAHFCKIQHIAMGLEFGDTYRASIDSLRMDVDFFLVDPFDELTNTNINCNSAILLYKYGHKDSLERIKKIYSNLLRFQNLSNIPVVVVESYFDPFQALLSTNATLEGAFPDIPSEEIDPPIRAEIIPIGKPLPNPFESLPNELIEYIFSYIFIHAPIALSCKRFHQLVTQISSKIPTGKSFATSIGVTKQLKYSHILKAYFTRMNFANQQEILKPIRVSHKLIRNRSEYARSKSNNTNIYGGLQKETFMHKCKRKSKICGYFLGAILSTFGCALMLGFGSACKNGGLVSCSVSTGMILTSLGSIFLIILIFLFVYIGAVWVIEDERRPRYVNSFLSPSDYDGCY